MRKGGTLQMANVSVYNMEGKEVETIELKRCGIRCRG